MGPGADFDDRPVAAVEGRGETVSQAERVRGRRGVAGLEGGGGGVHRDGAGEVGGDVVKGLCGPPGVGRALTRQ